MPNDSDIRERIARIEAMQESTMRNVTSWREQDYAARHEHMERLNRIEDNQAELAKKLGGMRSFASGVFAAAGVLWGAIVALFTFWKKWGM